MQNQFIFIPVFLEGVAFFVALRTAAYTCIYDIHNRENRGVHVPGQRVAKTLIMNSWLLFSALP